MPTTRAEGSYTFEGTAAVSLQARSEDSHAGIDEALARLARWIDDGDDDHGRPPVPQPAPILPQLPLPPAPPSGDARVVVHGGVVAGATTAALAAIALVLPMTFLPRPLRPSFAGAASAAAAPSASSVPSVPNVLDGESLEGDVHGGLDGRPTGARDTSAAVP